MAASVVDDVLNMEDIHMKKFVIETSLRGSIRFI
jgi:hypothetical protein